MFRKYSKATICFVFSLLLAASCGSSQKTEALEATTLKNTLSSASSSIEDSTTATSDAVENHSIMTAAQDESTTVTLKNPPYVGNIQMLSLGENPKTKLRYQPQEGTQTIRITQNQDYRLTSSDGLISYVIDVEATVKEVEGSFAISFKIIDVSAADGPQDQNGSDFLRVIQSDLFQRNSWGVTIDPAGQIIDDPRRRRTNDFHSAEAMLPFLRTGFAVVLPTEEVGVGAIWKVKQDTQLMAFPAVQETEYKIISIEGTVIELETKTKQFVEQGAEPTEPNRRMFEEMGEKRQAKEWESSGAGTMRIDLVETFPQFSGTVSSSQVVERNGENITFGQETEISIETK